MALLELDSRTRPAPPPVRSPAEAGPDAERAARAALRSQIAALERQLSAIFLTMIRYELGAPAAVDGSWVRCCGQPRLVGLAELERIRDDLVMRVRAGGMAIEERAAAQQASRLRLERILLEPHQHKFVRVTRRELGEPGCGAWEVRPRLGLVGVLMGWWRVKLSSGCPLALGRGRRAATLIQPA